MWVGPVIHQIKVIVMEIEDGCNFRIKIHLGKWVRSARELQRCLGYVVLVQMDISKSMDKFTGFEITHLSNHESE